MRLGLSPAVAPATTAQSPQGGGEPVAGAHSQDEEEYRAANARKAHFEHTYNAADPRAFFAAMREVDYGLPDRLAPTFRTLIEALRAERGLSAVDLLDLGCSYGVNGALLKYGLMMRQLCDRYGAAERAQLEPAALREDDARWLRQQPQAPALRVIGLDAAAQAVQYACSVGLIDDGIAANLESDPPSPLPQALLQDVDLVICTGCVGYVTHRSFARLMEALPGAPPPWVACSVLRMFAYDDIAATLAARGLATEMAVPTFAQRRFVSAEEQAHAADLIAARGLDPAGKESAGWYHANLFVSRPPREIARRPLGAILGCPAQRL